MRSSPSTCMWRKTRVKLPGAPLPAARPPSVGKTNSTTTGAQLARVTIASNAGVITTMDRPAQSIGSTTHTEKTTRSLRRLLEVPNTNSAPNASFGWKGLMPAAQCRVDVAMSFAMIAGVVIVHTEPVSICIQLYTQCVLLCLVVHGVENDVYYFKGKNRVIK